MQTIGQLHIVNKFLKDLQVEYLRIKDNFFKNQYKNNKREETQEHNQTRRYT